MAERDATYFAVFTGEVSSDPTAYDNLTADDLTVVPGTIRRMDRSQNTLYWYFLPLPVNVPFDCYDIYEVTVKNPTVGEDGTVTAYDAVTPIMNSETVQIVGKQKGETPVVLLDDVLSELDSTRQNYLLNKLEGMQIFITCCEKIDDTENKMRIENGEIFSVEE